MIGGNRIYPQTVNDNSFFRFYFEKPIGYAKSIFGPGEITPNSNGVFYFTPVPFFKRITSRVAIVNIY